ncbi:MAG: hypothetical protein JWN03_4587 [Nocardia sp.]|uniref:hypothetical protein n=1 Tax=Nocardia sp. TaxID=1821 RepID=UPI002614C0C4|nr:hypothetical protein [Nocardia sp.]MCU1644312.1 hypothetical protein [Nocardia sp.]
MTSAQSYRSPSPAWSTALPPARVDLVPLPAARGGVLVCSTESIAALSIHGNVVWREQAHRAAAVLPVLCREDAVALVADETVVLRSIADGTILRTFTVAGCVRMSGAPWGDLVCLTIGDGGQVHLRCFEPTGRLRWTTPLHGTQALVYGLIAMAEVIVVEQHGALWAFDRDGRTPWVADINGVSDVVSIDRTRVGTRINAEPCPVTSGRMLFELAGPNPPGLYVLDGISATLTPLAARSPIRRPYAVIPGGDSGHRIVGYGGRIEITPLEHEFVIEAIEWDTTTAWQCRMSAEPISLAAAPDGSVIVAASPTPEYWSKYHQFQDLRQQAFIRCVEPDGAVRWQWHPPGPLTHRPIPAPDGTVYVCSDNLLWALPLTGR